jgi:hypothetical protein
MSYSKRQINVFFKVKRLYDETSTTLKLEDKLDGKGVTLWDGCMGSTFESYAKVIEYFKTEYVSALRVSSQIINTIDFENPADVITEEEEPKLAQILFENETQEELDRELEGED